MTERPIYFDAETWLAQFEAVGGGWIVREYLSLMMQIEGRSTEDQRTAREMIASLSEQQQRILTAHLAARTPMEAGYA